MKGHIILLTTILTLLVGSNSRSQDFNHELSKLIQNIEKIKSYDVRIALNRKMPQQIQLSLRFLEADDMWRMDKTWMRFSLQREREGEHQRIAIVGDIARFVDSKIRPELDHAAEYDDQVVDLRLLGGLTSPLLNHDPEQRSIINRMFISTKVESKSFEVINTMNCLKWTKALDDGMRLSVLYDSEMKYRGCEAEFRGRKSRTWIETWGSDDGILFPSKVIYEEVNGLTTDILEEIVIESLDLNPTLTERDFSFASLGVRDGEYIVDRTKQPSKLGK